MVWKRSAAGARGEHRRPCMHPSTCVVCSSAVQAARSATGANEPCQVSPTRQDRSGRRRTDGRSNSNRNPTPSFGRHGSSTSGGEKAPRLFHFPQRSPYLLLPGVRATNHARARSASQPARSLYLYLSICLSQLELEAASSELACSHASLPSSCVGPCWVVLCSFLIVGEKREYS